MDPWSEWDDHNVHDGFRPGDVVGPYEILFPSASGGMATVWAARKRGARGGDNVVAVKLLSDALQTEDDARAMFLDEARTASRILHPNVVEIFACGEVRQRPYIAMEWIDGDSLAKVASTQKQRGSLLPLGWVLDVAALVCSGLHAAHEARDEVGDLLNLIHRDVTPQNVMVGFDGKVKVVDFGVAKSRAQTQVSRAGTLKGKTAYFSPEQVTGEKIDRRSDLFSMGCLLYLLVTGHPPFRGRGMVEVINQIANRVPQRPLDIMPELDPELDRIIMRALAKAPGDRYQTAAELRRELEKVRAGLGPPLTPREIGALVTGLFPGVAEVRRTNIASAVADLDRASSDAPRSDPRPARPEDATEVMMRSMALIFSGPPESSGRKSESSRKSDPGGGRKSDPSGGRKSDPSGGPKSVRGGRAAQRSDPGSVPVSAPGSGVSGPMSMRGSGLARARLPSSPEDENDNEAAAAEVAGAALADQSAAQAVAAPAPRSRGALWAALAVALAIVAAVAAALARRG
jgi:serine/threonine-protein kinase